MNLTEIKQSGIRRKRKKRVGRGPGSGHGKTSCRGHRGARSRSGNETRRFFEGGQMPLYRRLPKRGFTNPFKKEYAVVNVGSLEIFDADTIVDAQNLEATGLVKKSL